MWQILIVAGVLVCAIQSIRARRLLVSALWLAGTSALVALLIYLLGAPEIAVIELSVGAGLVTVLFVFAINIAGDEPIEPKSLVPRWLAGLIVLAAVGLLGWFGWQEFNGMMAVMTPQDFQNTLWGDRRLDLWLQIVLIFCGVLGVLGLLADEKPQSLTEEKLK
jgi:uncharacterized MnhB-related membrane protein